MYVIQPHLSTHMAHPNEHARKGTLAGNPLFTTMLPCLQNSCTNSTLLQENRLDIDITYKQDL